MTYVFIDASNIIYGAKESGNWKVSFQKLHKYLKEKYKARKIFYYTGINFGSESDITNIKKLKKIGYIVRSKPIKKIHQAPVYKKNICPKCKFGWTQKINRPPKTKANCDTDLTLDAIGQIKSYTKAIFLTGDGDFIPLFQHLQKVKKGVFVIGASKRTAIDIKKFLGNHFIDLAQIKNIIQK